MSGVAPAPLEKAAVNPLDSTELSAAKLMYMLPELDVTAAGTLWPLRLPSNTPDELSPSYTFKKSYPPSVANDSNCSVMEEPVVIVHEQAWFEE